MITYQIARNSDMLEIAQLHARSWQQNNRGIYTDDYLDNKVEGERVRVWTKRFQNPPNNQRIITAKSANQLCGFTCFYGGKDAKYGTYLDNIHIAKEWHGKGIGRQLMALAAEWSLKEYPNHGLYLFVFESNAPAIKFYEKLSGKSIDIYLFELGDGSGQKGRTVRYYWEKPELLLI